MNRQAIRSLVTVMALAGTAVAGTATVSSTVQEDFTVAYERASGEPTTATLSKGSSSVGYASVDVPDRGSTSITVSDGTGKVVAKGKVADNGKYVMLPKGEVYTLAGAGTITGPWEPYPGVVIVNALPEAYKVDLFGSSGKVGAKDVKLAKTMDVKQAIKLKAGDDRFKAVIHLPDGTTVESQTTVALGWYHVIHKAHDDQVTISAIGWIESAAKKKKK